MAQFSGTLDTPNGTGLTVRNNINTRNRAVQSMNSGSAAPVETLDYMWWSNLSVTPTEIMLRNGANDAFLKIMEHDVSGGAPGVFRLFSEGVQVLTAGNNAPFTANQTVAIVGALADLIIGSDIDTGSPAQIRLRGQNAVNEDVDAAVLIADISDNTDGSEDTSIDIQTFVAGTLADRIQIGAVVTVPGTFTAGTLQQGGTPVQTLIDNSLAALDSTDFAGPAAFPLLQNMAGEARRFTGGSATNVEVPTLTKDSIITIHNDGSAAVTFVQGIGSPTFQNGTGLAAGRTCTLVWLETNVVRILGENA